MTNPCGYKTVRTMSLGCPTHDTSPEPYPGCALCERDRLRDWATRRGHFPTCARVLPFRSKDLPLGAALPDCTCGLDAALAGVTDQPAVPRPTCGKCGLVDYGADKPLFCTDDGCPLRATDPTPVRFSLDEEYDDPTTKQPSG